jgi:very-short-patch-repair endonuclease
MNHFPVPQRLRKNARSMRKALTEPELKLWNELRAHRLMGLAFRRQMPIGSYIVDFACPSHRLIVEVDGAGHGHAGQIAHDQTRDTALRALGWTVLRVGNDEVLKDIDAVCMAIVRTIGERAFL